MTFHDKHTPILLAKTHTLTFPFHEDRVTYSLWYLPGVPFPFTLIKTVVNLLQNTVTNSVPIRGYLDHNTDKIRWKVPMNQGRANMIANDRLKHSKFFENFYKRYPGTMELYEVLQTHFDCPSELAQNALYDPLYDSVL